jgi:putative SOS response-associated peptidase YedK
MLDLAEQFTSSAPVVFAFKSASNSQPVRNTRQDGQPMAFAGLWEGYRWPDGNVTRSFTIITTDASADVAGLHDRMPVILETPDWPIWFGEAPGDPASLLRPSPTGILRVWPVDRRANIPGNNGRELLEPIEPDASSA